MALYQIKPPAEWAADALKRAEVDCLRVVRAFPPKDTDEGESEVLFLDSRERPRTAFLKCDGAVTRTAAGW